MDIATKQHTFSQKPPSNDENPFEIPNQETVASLMETEQIALDSSVKGYCNLDELFADLED